MEKKRFKTTSEMFLSNTTGPDPEETKPEAAPAAVPEQLPAWSKVTKESKTKRLQLLVRPTADALLTEYCKKNGTSKNALINELIEEFLNKTIKEEN